MSTSKTVMKSKYDMENQKRKKNMANAWMVTCHSHYCIFMLIILRMTIVNIRDAQTLST